MNIALCPPALVYLMFSVTQIMIDLVNGMQNTAVIKVIVTVMVTLLLQILCKQGLDVVSWMIVFIPFILMSVIVGMLLYVFGLNATTGSLSTPTTDASGNLLLYFPSYNPATHPIVYRSPYLVIPPLPSMQNALATTNVPLAPIPRTSSPAYQS